MSDEAKAERIARLSWLLDGARRDEFIGGSLLMEKRAPNPSPYELPMRQVVLTSTEIIAALGAILAHLRSGR